MRAQGPRVPECKKTAPSSESLSISPDGRHVAYATGKGAGLAGLVLQPLFMGKSGSFRMVVDGQESSEYVAVSAAQFSPERSRVAYAGPSGTRMLDTLGRPLGRQQQFVVVNSVEGAAYDRGGAAGLPDGQRIAHKPRRDKKWAVVLDSVEGKWCDAVGDPVFSPDGRRTAHGAKRDGKVVIVLDGVEGAPHDSASLPVFSPDEGAAYDEVGPLIFSPDGRRYAHAARRGQRWLVVVDGVEGKAAERVGQPVFSPDGRSVAHLARDGSRSASWSTAWRAPASTGSGC